MVGYSSLSSFYPQGPIIKDSLVVEAIYRPCRIVNLVKEDVSEALRVSGYWILDHFDVQYLAILSKHPFEIILIDPSWDSCNIDVVTYICINKQL